jgi:hypothetical protein
MRQYSELVSLFGRAEVERAYARCGELNQWVNSDLAHRFEVIKAQQELMAVIHDPPEAVKLCELMPDNVRHYIIRHLVSKSLVD